MAIKRSTENKNRLSILLGLAAASCVAACSSSSATDPGATCLGQKCDSPNDLGNQTFEYIVVGSGAGGGPLAANLARAGHSVLLLEAGEDTGGRLDYQVPAFNAFASEDPAMRWDFFVRHYQDDARSAQDSKYQAEQGGVLYPRAATLGGCTAHNAMLTVYPHDDDWDQIAKLTGDSSWSAQNMRKYFERMERKQYGGDNAGHGTSGWLGTEQVDSSIALGNTQIINIVHAAADTFAGFFGGGLGELLHLSQGRDLNRAAADRDTTEGLYTIPLATDHHKRNGTREFILGTVKGGFPLTVKLKALVTRVLFDDATDAGGLPHASGVELLDAGHLYQGDPQAAAEQPMPKQLRATREVILSAGAFNTPQLLKLSGVGPRAELDHFAIPVRVDSPGVGENLQDRYEVGVVSHMNENLHLLDDCTFGAAGDKCVIDWQNGSGPYTSSGSLVGIVKRSSTAGSDPDLFIFGAGGNFRGYYPGYSHDAIADKRHFTWAVLKAHTGNTAGQVKLRSADPRVRPEINFHYFDEGTPGGDQKDLEAVVDGVELARKITQASHFTEEWPADRAQSRDQIRQFVKNEAWGHHASCSAKIGADGDPMAVLDSHFRVRGTSGLRVVDASVFPHIPGFFIAVPIYMVSEKASDVILGDAH